MFLRESWRNLLCIGDPSYEEKQQSKNEILRYVRKNYFPVKIPFPGADDILQAARELLQTKEANMVVNFK